MRGLREKQAKAVEKLKEIDPESDIFRDSRMKIPKFIKGTLSKPSAENPETIARKFLEEYRKLQHNRSQKTFSTESDEVLLPAVNKEMRGVWT